MAIGPKYFIVSPKPSKVVLEPLNVAVSTSATRPISSAEILKPEEISDEISDTRPISMPAAFVIAKIAGIDFSIWSALNPAIAK